jgi:hypothetical protein
MQDTLTEAQQSIVDWLTRLRDICQRNGGVQDYHYFGVGDFLMQHGVWHEPRPLPPNIRPSAPRQCFSNSFIYGKRHGLRYVEGYAVPDLGACMLPVHHGWNLDRDGHLIDSTWDKQGLAYLGVEFSLGRAENAIWFDDGCVLDNLRSRFAIFKEPWSGENFNLKWRRSNKVRRLIGQLDAAGV